MIDGTSSRTLPVRLRIEHGKGHSGSNKIEFQLTALDQQGLQVKETAVFFIPR